MMNAPPKPLYPSFIELTASSAGARDTRLWERHSDVTRHAEQIRRAASDLSREQPHTSGEMLDVAVRLSEALAEDSGGVAAYAALSQHRPPREIALTWYRRKMNLALASADASPGEWLGLSGAHLGAMVFMVLFSLSVMAVEVGRRRQSRQLIAHLRQSERAVPMGARPAQELQPESETVPARAPVSDRQLSRSPANRTPSLWRADRCGSRRDGGHDRLIFTK